MKLLLAILLVVLVVAGLDILAFQVLNHVPEDAIFNLGPVLGLMKEGRLVDLLVYKEFDAYFGYPHLFFYIQLVWYSFFGFSAWSVYLFVTFVHVCLCASFIISFRNFLRPIQLAVLALILFGSVYFMSGRPDSIALIFVFPILRFLFFMQKSISANLMAKASILLVVIFFIHPLCFLLTAAFFYVTLLVEHKMIAIRYILVSGFLVALISGGLYLFYILSNLEAWKDLFLRLATKQERFNISALIKFYLLNGALFVFLGCLLLFFNRKLGVLLIKSPYIWLSLSLNVLIFALWGMSYYYIYPFVFMVFSILATYSQQDSSQQTYSGNWAFNSVIILSIFVSLYQGPGGRIFQGLTEPNYRVGMMSFRNHIQEFDFHGKPVVADFQLMPELLKNNKDVTYLRTRKNLPIPDDSYIVFVSPSGWNHQSLGDWRNNPEYEVVKLSDSFTGLPSLYNFGERGENIQLVILYKRKIL